MVNKRHFEPGTKVRHFKYDSLPEEEKRQHRYEYEVIGNAIETETGSEVVVYRELASTHRLFVRPVDIFYSEVDNVKYPNTSQKYRFNKIREE